MGETSGGRARSVLIGLAVALVAAAASAQSDNILVGVDRARFAWDAAPGAPHGYMVRLSRGGSLEDYRWVTDTTVVIPVAPGEQIAIAVAAGAPDANGVFRLGPQSPISERVSILRAPRFDVTGAWLLQCASCSSLALRPLADASVVEAEVPGHPEPWQAVARAALASGQQHVVWYNPVTGQIDVWDLGDLQSIPGGQAAGETSLRAVGAADFNADGIDGFLVQHTATSVVSMWGLTRGGFEHVVELPGPSATLAAADDLDGDGAMDLVWHDRDAQTVDVLTAIRDPWVRVSTPLYQLPARRLMSGVPADARIAGAGDFDADGQLDLVLRHGDGLLEVLHLRDQRVHRITVLPSAPGDANRVVVGAIDMDGVPGDEIALQDGTTGSISIAYPAKSSFARTVVLTPGVAWRVVDVVD